MNAAISPELKEIMQTVHYRPAVSIILPFEPKMSLKEEITQSLKLATDKVARELRTYYPGELGELVLQKLKSIVSQLNFSTYHRSVAIFVSPVFEKVLYLDIPVEERVIVDESFEIRDLVYSKKQLHKYLVLVLSANESRIYLGNTNSFVRILSDTPESIYAYVNDAPEKVGNFTDSSARKDIVRDKFLHHIDHSLDIILKAYHLPLFVLGTPKLLGHFGKITRHSAAVLEYIHGNYEEAGPLQLKELLQPYIADWQKVVQKDLLKQLGDAVSRQKLVSGIQKVWAESVNHKARLLVVEKNYMHAAVKGGSEDHIYESVEPFKNVSYIKDAVDDIIEKVLLNGGDVEFVDEGLLQDYEKIALVMYY